MEGAKPFPVVGIGASAGGVEALQALFESMATPPADASFVIVTHLGAGHVSALPQILSRHTRLDVCAAQDGDALRPGVVHVSVTDATVTLADGKLRVQPQPPGAARPRHPIDIFLASLAESHREWAVGVVLSGNGSDGTLGLKAIRERGGLTLAQGFDGHPPRYPNMPASAVAGGTVDLVLPITEIPGMLSDFARGLAALAKVEDDGAATVAAGRRDALKTAICRVLRDRTGHDFAGYKDGTFFRRVHRRIQVLRLDGGMDAYVTHLLADADEAHHLFRDLLIGVTGFFRDPDAFAALEKDVIPTLLRGRGPDDALRVWVPGCATGEEAYSLAILLQEALDAHPNPPRVQVFATDIDDAALGVARAGRYPAQLLDNMPPERRARHFTFDGTTYAAVKSLRELCVFSAHSLVRDAPFARVDLVSCRNLLIYLGGRLQEQVVPVFHYALRPGGFLFLGVAENLARHAELFSCEDRTHRIYRRRHNPPAAGLAALPMRVEPAARAMLAPPWQGTTPSGPGVQVGAARALRQAAEAFVLDGFAPSHLVVDRHGDVIHQSGRLGRYLEPAPGPPSRQLFTLARRGLRLELRAALRYAIETGRHAVRPYVELQVDERRMAVALTVAPLPVRDPASDPLYIVVFNDLGPARAAEVAPVVVPEGAGAESALIAQLEREVQEMRERMLTATEEYETTTEELKAANEEMLSINEELQSTNEELETSKEELQSVNEELRTVNVELAGNVEALDRANADMRNLFESTEVATVFLDANMIIRSFTPAVTAIFNLMPGDVGRPLTDFASRLEGVDIRAEMQVVVETREMQERRVTAADGSNHYLMRLLPYRTTDGRVDGVIATFIDVTKVVEGEVLATLVDELNHRVRNMLQVVEAVASHTLRRSSSLQDFEKVFQGRIGALGRAHQLVSAGGWTDVSLGELVLKELGPYVEGEDRLVLEGEELRLKPNAALALGMVLHELATNAAKYGALSTPAGRVTISWGQEEGEAEAIVLRWSELGGPRVAGNPERRGFGSELIERQVRHGLGGTIESAFEASGLQATLTLPLKVAVPQRRR